MTLPLLSSTPGGGGGGSGAGGGGGGSASGDESFNDSDDTLRGVPLRQRQLPASFWQEPNVPRYYHPPSPLTLSPPMPEYVAMPRPEYSWATVAYTGGAGSGGATDYGYGGPAAATPTLLQCSCPHCTEKHLRQMAYSWNPDGDVSSAVAKGSAWMWSATTTATPKGPAFVQPYASPYPAGTPTAATSPLDPSETYVGWKATATTPATNAAYLPLPYSFN